MIILSSGRKLTPKKLENTWFLVYLDTKYLDTKNILFLDGWKGKVHIFLRLSFMLNWETHINKKKTVHIIMKYFNIKNIKYMALSSVTSRLDFRGSCFFTFECFEV